MIGVRIPLSYGEPFERRANPFHILWFESEAFVLAAALMPTAIVGAWMGGRLTHKLPVRNLKLAFFVLLAIAGVRMMTGALGSLSTTS